MYLSKNHRYAIGFGGLQKTNTVQPAVSINNFLKAKTDGKKHTTLLSRKCSVKTVL